MKVQVLSGVQCMQQASEEQLSVWPALFTPRFFHDGPIFFSPLTERVSVCFFYKKKKMYS